MTYCAQYGKTNSVPILDSSTFMLVANTIALLFSHLALCAQQGQAICYSAIVNVDDEYS